MSSVKEIDLGLKSSVDELFMDDRSRAEARQPRIYDIPLTEIDDFPDHPFKIKMDEDMDQLVASIRERGVITPITLRKKEDGRYEIVSGHRRKKACELLGLETVRADVQELTRDEAVLIMVDSNFQRSVILPSEKAFAYRMKLEAMKRAPGRPPKENGVPVGPDFSGKSRELLAANSPDSKTQILRYVRLTYLVQPLLDMVDEGRIAFRPAVELSYLKEPEQNALVETMAYEDTTPSHAQAIKMRRFSEEGRLDADVILSILCEEKPNQREHISIPSDKLHKWIPTSASPKQTEDIILKALEYYYRYLQRQREYGR